jgi:hypothetical protein
VKDPDRRVSLAERVEGLGCAIRAAVVDEDDLVAPHRLPQYGGEPRDEGPEHPVLVVTGQDDAQFRAQPVSRSLDVAAG